jgi:hypothetical protein
MQGSLASIRLGWPGRLLASCFSLMLSLLLAEAALAAAPTISGTPPTYVIVGSKYSFQPKAYDRDGQKLRFSITNKPAWASFNTSTGLLTGTPTAVGYWRDIRISVTDGQSTVSLPSFSLRATARNNRPPTISGTPPTTATVGVQYRFQAIGKDADGDVLIYQIANKPSWASFDQWTGVLSGTPSSSHVGTYSNIKITVKDGGQSASLPVFSIKVSAAKTNRAPTISGTPPTTARVGTAYSFRPTASDPDGDTLGFSIQNKPSWASFSTSNGTLSGTPTASGTHSNIIISVSDGKIKKSLPAFTITVSKPQTTNTAPKISGTPATSVTAGSAYSFKPTASDADGDKLTFSISNKPSWASFNTSTGQLSGTPSASNAGTYSNIVISVSDGRASVSLPAFSIKVNAQSARNATLSWSAPTQNTDGSTLTNLAGYRIHYGTSANTLSETIQVSNPGLTTYVIENLSPGTYYFAVSAYTSSGTQSALSNVVSKAVQ